MKKKTRSQNIERYLRLEEKRDAVLAELRQSLYLHQRLPLICRKNYLDRKIEALITEIVIEK